MYKTKKILKTKDKNNEPNHINFAIFHKQLTKPVTIYYFKQYVDNVLGTIILFDCEIFLRLIYYEQNVHAAKIFKQYYFA